MGDDSEDILAELRAAVERRVREQLGRHLRVDPSADLRRVVDIQMEQERERLDRMEAEFDDQGEDGAAEAVRVLRDEWLPKLARDLKRR